VTDLTRNKQPILLTLAFMLLLTGCRSHRQGEDRFSDIRGKILDFMEDKNVPSVSVAVAQRGKIIWEESFGWANREKKIKATPQTMYELASIAKVFTATGLMVLKERGVVDLDAPVDRYLGDITIDAFGVDPSGVTLRRLLQHTSGLPMYWGEPYRADTTRPFTPKDMLDRYAILAFTPGKRELYSNVGIAMANYIAERVSKQPYAEFLRQQVFLPLGMTNSARLSTPPTTDEFAQEYQPDGAPWVYTEGTYASAHDLLRFAMFHLKDHLPDQQRILSDSTIELMQTALEVLSDFRLPWLVLDYGGFPALVFTGASGAVIALIPEADLAIVVLSNRLQADTPRIAKWIASAVLDDFQESQRIPTTIEMHQKIQPGTLSRGALAGTWKGAIRTPERELPVEISFSRFGSPEMRSLNDSGSWGDWTETMSTLRGNYSAGIFSAYFPVRIPTEDTRGHDHWTWIYVGLKADTLQGYAVAHAADGPYFGLPYCIRLEREKEGGNR
jgi:CubicO group peptidase (beta-lactamase class C family)